MEIQISKDLRIRKSEEGNVVIINENNCKMHIHKSELWNFAEALILLKQDIPQEVEKDGVTYIFKEEYKIPTVGEYFYSSYGQGIVQCAKLIAGNLGKRAIFEIKP